MRRTRTAFLLALVVLAACDDPFIDPFANDGRYFTVWGWIDPAASLQTVRVIPVTRWPAEAREPSDRNASIDARVFLIDLNRKTETEWTHRLTRLDDGTLGHLFSGSLVFEAAGHYRLEVRRSDGHTASAEVRVPTGFQAGGAQVGDSYEGPDGHVLQDVVLRGIASPWDIRVTYLVEGSNTRRGAWIDYGRPGGRTATGDWAFTIDLTADQAAVHADIEAGIAAGEVDGIDENGRVPPFGLAQMGLRLTVLDEGWDLPEGPIDEAAFTGPDGISNVEGGYGYWGAGYPYVYQWGVTRALSRQLGWDF